MWVICSRDHMCRYGYGYSLATTIGLDMYNVIEIKTSEECYLKMA